MTITESAQAQSLLGKPLFASVARTGQDVAALERKLEAAKSTYESAPDDVQKFMFYVLAVDALHEYRTGIELYSQGIEKWPEEAMLYCHRGHRYLNLREFDRGMQDLQLADELLPGSPDILYHIGLAHYMRGEFESALDAFVRGNDATSDDGEIQPTSSLRLVGNAEIIRMGNADWIFTTLSRLGRFEEAEKVLETVNPELQAGGNMIFYMTRVLFYKRLISEEEIQRRFTELGRGAHSMGYGVGAYHLSRGDKQKAREYFEEVVTGTLWPAWAYVAAEAELARGL